MTPAPARRAISLEYKAAPAFDRPFSVAVNRANKGLGLR